MILTAQELIHLRDSHPHVITPYVSVLVPKIVYVGTITGTPARGANELTVVDVQGNISNIVAGQTIIVGTTLGDDDVTNERRYRSRSGQVLKIDENSIKWEDGQFITVLENWELWGVYPYYTVDPITFYKDRDIPYIDENFYPPPVAIAGQHKAGFLDSGSLIFSLDASESYAIATGASITSFLWNCTGGIIASPSSAITIIDFTVVGTYWLSLTVTDSNGKSQLTRRVIFVHERVGGDEPYKDFQFSSPITRSWSAGGATTRLQVFGDASINQFPDRALVVIWCESSFNGTEAYIGNSNILFAGYIKHDTITQTPDRTGTVQFDIATIDQQMKLRKMFSVGLLDNSNPSVWWEFKDLRLHSAVHHFWKWHSTLFDVTDVRLPSTSPRMYAVEDFVDGSLYDMVDTFTMQHGIFAHVCCATDGTVYLEIDPNYLNDVDRDAVDIVMALMEPDRMGDPDIELARDVNARLSLVMLSGTSYDGATFVPHVAKAPGEVPSNIGEAFSNMERQVLLGEADANEKSGRVLAISNTNILDIRMNMAGNYSFMDVVPQQWYTLSLDAADNKRRLTFTDKRLLPSAITVSLNTQNGSATVNAAFREESIGDDGIPGRFPTSFPAPIPPDPEDPTDAFDGRLVTFDNPDGVHKYIAATNSWTAINGALTAAQMESLHGNKDPWWYTPAKQNTTDPAFAILWSVGLGFIARSTDMGENWVLQAPGNPPGGTFATCEVIQYEGSVFENGMHFFLVREEVSGAWLSWILKTTDDGVSWAWASIPAVGSVGGEGGEYIDKTVATTVYPTYGDMGQDWFTESAESLTIVALTPVKFLIFFDSNTNLPAFDRAGIGVMCCEVIDPDGTPTVSFGSPIPILRPWAETDPDSEGWVWSVGVKGARLSDDAALVFYTVNHYTDPDGGTRGDSDAVRILSIVGTTLAWTSVPDYIYEPPADAKEQGYNYWSKAIYAEELVSGTTIISIVYTWFDNYVWKPYEGEEIRLKSGIYDHTSGVLSWNVDDVLIHPALETPPSGYYPAAGVIGTSYRLLKVGDNYVLVFQQRNDIYDGSWPPLDYRIAAIVFKTDGNTLSALGEPQLIDHFADFGIDTTMYTRWLDAVSMDDSTFVVAYVEDDLPHPPHPITYMRICTVVDNGLDDLTVTSSARFDFDAEVTAIATMKNHSFIRSADNRAMFFYTINNVAYMIEFTMDGGIFMFDTQLLVAGDARRLGANMLGNSATYQIGVVAYNLDPIYNDIDVAIIRYEPESAVLGDVKAEWMSLGRDKLYVTTCDDTSLLLYRFATAALSMEQNYTLALATHAEVTARTYFAAPFCINYSDDYVYIYGRFINSLIGLVHVIVSGDGGDSVAIVENGWGGDHCGAFAVTSAGVMHAVRNGIADITSYNTGTTVLAERTTLPFYVFQGALYLSPDGFSIIGGTIAGSGDELVMYSRLPYRLWHDTTFDHPLTGSVMGVTIV